MSTTEWVLLILYITVSIAYVVHVNVLKNKIYDLVDELKRQSSGPNKIAYRRNVNDEEPKENKNNRIVGFRF
jgi:hypothetical protein